MPILGLPTGLPPSTPSHFDIEKVIRPNILALQPYRCARDDYQNGILLDANENALGHSIDSISAQDESLVLHRYPDPLHNNIKSRLADLRGVPGPEHLFLGVGSDEVIDMLIRVCVAPGKDKILVTPPTYGMYSVCAQVNDVGVVKCPLELTGESGEGGAKGRFSLRVDEVKKAIDADPSIKLVFICSPGNPTGTCIPLDSVRAILDYENFKGIVVVDEAYIDFVSDSASAVQLVKDYSNVVALQTLSKSFGLAAIRLGIAIAQPPLIQVLTNTKAPYNIATPSANLAYSALSPASISLMKSTVAKLATSRGVLAEALVSLEPLGVGKPIGGNEANFIVVPILNRETGKPDNARAHKVYISLAEKNGVVVRYRGGEPGCKGCLRITVGSDEEVKTAVEQLSKVLKEF